VTALLLIAFAAVTVARAQAPLEFEVASVKVNKSGNGVRGGCHGIDSKYTPGQAAAAPPLGRCVITGGRLSHMIGIAWDLNTIGQLQGGPDWVIRGFDRFDIQAEAADPTRTTEAQLRSMLQNALIDRFQLKFHRQTVERPGFALLVARNGPRLKPSKSQDVVGDQFKPTPGQPATLDARRYSMARLVEVISFVRQQPVLDQTHLTGDFDFTLNWDQDQGPTIQTALQEQLGLKLEPQKVPIELFVIDSAQKPSAN
jgi:uncharacterized protein (TIGR03435 family)